MSFKVIRPNVLFKCQYFQSNRFLTSSSNLSSTFLSKPSTEVSTKTSDSLKTLEKNQISKETKTEIIKPTISTNVPSVLPQTVVKPKEIKEVINQD